MQHTLSTLNPHLPEPFFVTHLPKGGGLVVTTPSLDFCCKKESGINLRYGFSVFQVTTTKAHCKVGNSTVRAHHADLVKHAKSAKHLESAKGRGSGAAKLMATTFQPVSLKPTQDQRSTDLKIATFVACHCSINSVDHLGQIVASSTETCCCG